MKWLNWISIIILIIGGLNWGLVGLFHFNLVSAIFMHAPILATITYIIVGLAALWGIYMLCLKCSGKNCF